MQDLKIIDLVLESGRALVLAFNKWDLLDDERRRYLEREIEQDLSHVAWAPRVNISAKTGRHMEKLVPALETGSRIVGYPDPDRQVQRLSGRAHGGAPAPGPWRQPAAHPVRNAGRPAARRRSSLFTTGFLDPQYRRFITVGCARSSGSRARRSAQHASARKAQALKLVLASAIASRR